MATVITSNQGNIVMVKTLYTAEVLPQITIPATQKFSELGTREGHRLGKMGWFLMMDFDQALLSILNKQHCPSIGLHAPVDYGSFELKYLSPKIPRTFPWIVHIPRVGMQIKISSFVNECPFLIQKDFYIPASWAKKVTLLVQVGIVQLRTFHQKEPVGICWDGTEITADEMMMALFKN